MLHKVLVCGLGGAGLVLWEWGGMMLCYMHAEPIERGAQNG